MDLVGEKETDWFRLTEAKYLFTVGRAYQEAYHPERAREEYMKSFEIMDPLLGDHTDKARCLNAIGNCYQLLEEPDSAIQYFNLAYDMRERLSGEEHYDMPVYKSQIGAVSDRKGDYDEAIKCYKSAIDLEEKLKISGYKSTATYYRNIANAYLFKKQYAEAMEPAQKAYDIRKEVLGGHPDTTRSVFQLGLIWNLQKEKEKAVPFYKEAWEMEKSLEKGHHSAVRDRIVEDLQELYDDLHRKKEKRLFEEDALNFYCRIWDEEKSFKEFQFSASARSIINMIIDLYKALGSNKSKMKGYQEEALRFRKDALTSYAKKWEELGRMKERELDHSRKEVILTILKICEVPDLKKELSQYRREALTFYKKLWEEKKDEMDWKSRCKRALNAIVKLAKCLKEKATVNKYKGIKQVKSTLVMLI